MTCTDMVRSCVCADSNTTQRHVQTDFEKTKTSSVGSGLLSQGPASQLPSALEGLTSRFGMGLGVPPPLEPPTELVLFTC